jgi:methionyl aminopeptidase
MRGSAVRFIAAVGKGRYHPAPEKFGKYPVLPSSLAMTAYPESLFVPRSIPRPPYVPANFFDAPWGDHDTVELDERAFLARGIQLGGPEEMKIRKVAALAAEVLAEIGKLVKVCRGHLTRRLRAESIARSDDSSARRSCTSAHNRPRGISLHFRVWKLPEELLYFCEQRHCP